MNNLERRDAQMAYISDEAVMEEQKVCRRILQELNTVDRSDFEKIGQLVKQLFGNPAVLLRLWFSHRSWKKLFCKL